MPPDKFQEDTGDGRFGIEAGISTVLETERTAPPGDAVNRERYPGIMRIVRDVGGPRTRDLHRRKDA